MLFGYLVKLYGYAGATSTGRSMPVRIRWSGPPSHATACRDAVRRDQRSKWGVSMYTGQLRPSKSGFVSGR